VQFRCRIEEENRERCTRQSVPIAAKNVKSHSNPTEADPFIAESAIQKEDRQDEDIRLNLH
jgi:hypothetical protein